MKTLNSKTQTSIINRKLTSETFLKVRTRTYFIYSFTAFYRIICLLQVIQKYK